QIKNYKVFGLDYYTHRKDGYIDSLRTEMKKILQKNNVYLPEFEHGFLELVTGYLFASQIPELKEEYLKFAQEKSEENLDKFISYLKPSEKIVMKLLKPMILKVINSYNKMFDDPLSVLYTVYSIGSKKYLNLFKNNAELKRNLEDCVNSAIPYVKEEITKKNSVFNKSLNVSTDLNYVDNKHLIPVTAEFY
ncbi:MAG: hypothetical protein QW524_03870, partial [Candidatus Woesearchaeota archaeon]